MEFKYALKSGGHTPAYYISSFQDLFSYNLWKPNHEWVK